MSIDLNQAEEQKEFGGPIPPGSAVKVRLSIRHPKSGREKIDQHGQIVPLITRSESGFEYLDCEMEVVSGTFKERKIWQNLGVGGAGKEKAVQIAGRTLRAMVEASRGVAPVDQSPQAVSARRLNSWDEMNGMEFGIIVDCAKTRPGDRYVNNEIKRVITPEHELYARIMAGGEVITDNPIPEIPKAAQGPTPSWGAPKTATPVAPAQAPLPAWGGQAAPAPATTSAQPPAAPAAPASGGAPAWAQAS